MTWMIVIFRRRVSCNRFKLDEDNNWGTGQFDNCIVLKFSPTLMVLWMRNDLFDNNFASVRDIQLDSKVRSDNGFRTNTNHIPCRQHVRRVVPGPYHRFSSTL